MGPSLYRDFYSISEKPIDEIIPMYNQTLIELKLLKLHLVDPNKRTMSPVMVPS